MKQTNWLTGREYKIQKGSQGSVCFLSFYHPTGYKEVVKGKYTYDTKRLVRSHTINLIVFYSCWWGECIFIAVIHPLYELGFISIVEKGRLVLYCHQRTRKRVRSQQ